MNIVKLGIAIKDIKGPASLLVRHAERPNIPFRDVDHLVKITDQGRKSTEELGRLIGDKLGSVATSSVPRCLDTSEAIIKGSGNLEIPINISWRLGNPGIWITDGEAAWSEFLKHGLNQIIKYQVEGKILNGFRSLKEGIDIMLDYIFGIANENEGINILVSHDAVIAPFLGYLLGTSDTAEILPSFLEGVLLSRTESGLKVYWRDKWFNISDGA